jgi:hypothetical protein
MPETIDYFMWGYQTQFRVRQRLVAKRVFELVDKQFDPQLFLVGILLEERTGWHRACVDPEKDFWIQSEDFDPTLELADKIRPAYPDSQIVHSQSTAKECYGQDLLRRSVRDGISTIIDKQANKPSHLSYFVSYPSRVDQYLVSAVLGLQTAILRAYPLLQKDSVPIHKYRNVSVRTSFIDAVTHTYLDRISGELQLPNPGSESSDLNPEEILRTAANSLMTGVAYRSAQDHLEWEGLFSACSNISSTYYEKVAGHGTLVLARKNHPAIKPVVEFSAPMKLGLTRGARKLLQLASQGLVLHTDGSDIYGLARVGNYNESNEDLFRIGFLEHHHWEVVHGDQVLMRVKFGQPYLIKPRFDPVSLGKDLHRVFSKIADKDVKRIVDLVEIATNEKHGTMLLISDDARQESERLRTQGTPINPKRLTSKLLKNLTPIDGTVILSPKGTCYSIGTVLDGMASQNGNPARGARYNSALRYVESSKVPCMAIAISEDGDVNFFSNH